MTVALIHWNVKRPLNLFMYKKCDKTVPYLNTVYYLIYV